LDDGENNAPKTSFELSIGLACGLLAFLDSELIAAIRALNSSSVSSILLLAIPMGLLTLQTAKEQTHPQTKSVPWIPTCKTGQRKNF